MDFMHGWEEFEMAVDNCDGLSRSWNGDVDWNGEKRK